MKVVSPYEELKSWFSLENYEQLKSLTIKELHTELAFREAIFDSVNFGWEVSFGDIKKLENKLIMFSMDFFEENGDFKKELKKKPITKTMRDFFLNQNSSKIYVSFDLGMSSDEEIITALQTMLPILRKEYEIEPVKTEKIGLAKIRKLVDYNIIPMMDLLIWAKFKKVKISNMVLSRVLYPDFTSEIRGEDHIKDTDRPVAEKSLNGETTRSLEYFISKNSHLLNIPISELGSF